MLGLLFTDIELFYHYFKEKMSVLLYFQSALFKNNSALIIWRKMESVLSDLD